MRESDRRHLAQLARGIERGQLGRSDVVALFMILRGSAKRGSIVRDIGDCVAHDERDRGDLYVHANQFVRSVRRALGVGGVMESRVLYPVEDLLNEIIDLLAQQSVTLDRTAADSRVDAFVRAVADVLDGVTIKVRMSHVACRLSGGDAPGFAIDFLRPMPGGVIEIPGPVTLLFPLLRSTSPDVKPDVVARNQAEATARASSRSMFESPATPPNRP